MVRHFRIPSRLPLKLEELGVPVSSVLRHAGLRHDFFQQPRLLLNTEELFALCTSKGERTPWLRMLSAFCSADRFVT
jgi:hypothetical protein